MARKRPASSAGTTVVLQHESRILADNPLGDPHVRRLAAWLPPGYDEDRGKGRGKRCRTFRTVGHLSVPHAKAGTNTVLFLGRLGGKPLRQGSYRLTATPAGGKARTLRLTVLP